MRQTEPPARTGAGQQGAPRSALRGFGPPLWRGALPASVGIEYTHYLTGKPSPSWTLFDSVEVSGKTLVLRESTPLAANHIFSVRINDTSRIRDGADNQAVAPAQPVELVNLYGVSVATFEAPGAPRRAATDPAMVDSNTLTVKLDQTVAPFSKVAGTGGFTISGAAAATSVTHVEGHATTVVLTLDREVGAGETGLTLSYQPATPAVSNLYDEKLAAFTGQAVANARADTTAPTLVASASTISGTDVRRWSWTRSQSTTRGHC